MTNTLPPLPPPVTSESEWTSVGLRLFAQKFPDFLVLSVETQWAQRDGKRAVFVLGQVTVVNGSTLTHALGFVRHALSFYGDDDLVEFGSKAVKDFFSERTEDASQPRPANPNAN